MNPKPSKTPQREGPADPLIFVVDDSSEVGEMLEVFFRHAGYAARVFTDPVKALVALNAATLKPRVMVSDFQMPGLNGLELIQRCKQVHPGLRIISASGYLLVEEMEKYPIQPDRILPKPYRTAELLEIVKSFLETPPSGPGA